MIARKAALLLVALVASIALAACGGSDSDSGQASGEISLLVFGDPEELQAYRALIRSFRTQEPDISVNLIEASDRDDLLARLATSFAGGKPPDLFLINYRFYGQFASRGVLEPLESRLEESDAFEPDDFYEQALEAFRWDGEQTCLPQNVSSLVVYYNRDLFRASGVAEPKAGWTWRDLVGSALKLTRDIDRDGEIDQYGIGIEPTLIRIAPFVWSSGGELVDDDENPTRFTLDTPAATKALQDFIDLRQVHLVVPTEQEAESEDDETRFLNGRLAMLFDSRRATPTLRTITDFDWDIAPLPARKEPAGILHSDAYCLTKASDRKEAAWRFVEFALGPEGQRITARSGRTVPSLISVSRSRAFLDPAAKPRNSRVFLDAITHVRRVPAVSTWPEIEDASEPILENGFYRTLSREDVVRELNEAAEPLFARAER
jgi:multiple sugar transport system substrate-binding protein